MQNLKRAVSAGLRREERRGEPPAIGTNFTSIMSCASGCSTRVMLLGIATVRKRRGGHSHQVGHNHREWSPPVPSLAPSADVWASRGGLTARPRNVQGGSFRVPQPARRRGRIGSLANGKRDGLLRQDRNSSVFGPSRKPRAPQIRSGQAVAKTWPNANDPE